MGNSQSDDEMEGEEAWFAGGAGPGERAVAGNLVARGRRVSAMRRRHGPKFCFRDAMLPYLTLDDVANLSCTSWASREAFNNVKSLTVCLVNGGASESTRASFWVRRLNARDAQEAILMREGQKSPSKFYIANAQIPAEMAEEELRNVENDIVRDVSRTFPEHPFFAKFEGAGQSALASVLKAIAHCNPQVRYCQGMNFIAAVFLITKVRSTWAVQRERARRRAMQDDEQLSESDASDESGWGNTPDEEETKGPRGEWAKPPMHHNRVNGNARSPSSTSAGGSNGDIQMSTRHVFEPSGAAGWNTPETLVAEQESFWLMMALMSDHGPLQMEEIWQPGFPGLRLRSFQFRKLLAKHCPHLFKHFAQLQFDTDVLVSQWFITLFAYSFSVEMLLPLWDAIFSLGWKMVLAIAIARLKADEARLLSCDTSGIGNWLRTLRDRDNTMPLSPRRLLEMAFQLQITEEEVKQYEDGFCIYMVKERVEMGQAEWAQAYRDAGPYLRKYLVRGLQLEWNGPATRRTPGDLTHALLENLSQIMMAKSELVEQTRAAMLKWREICELKMAKWFLNELIASQSNGGVMPIQRAVGAKEFDDLRGYLWLLVDKGVLITNRLGVADVDQDVVKIVDQVYDYEQAGVFSSVVKHRFAEWVKLCRYYSVADGREDEPAVESTVSAMVPVPPEEPSRCAPVMGALRRVMRMPEPGDANAAGDDDNAEQSNAQELFFSLIRTLSTATAIMARVDARAQETLHHLRELKAEQTEVEEDLLAFLDGLSPQNQMRPANTARPASMPVTRSGAPGLASPSPYPASIGAGSAAAKSPASPAGRALEQKMQHKSQPATQRPASVAVTSSPARPGMPSDGGGMSSEMVMGGRTADLSGGSGTLGPGPGSPGPGPVPPGRPGSRRMPAGPVAGQRYPGPSPGFGAGPGPSPVAEPREGSMGSRPAYGRADSKDVKRSGSMRRGLSGRGTSWQQQGQEQQQLSSPQLQQQPLMGAHGRGPAPSPSRLGEPIVSDTLDSDSDDSVDGVLARARAAVQEPVMSAGAHGGYGDDSDSDEDVLAHARAVVERVASQHRREATL